MQQYSITWVSLIIKKEEEKKGYQNEYVYGMNVNDTVKKSNVSRYRLCLMMCRVSELFKKTSPDLSHSRNEMEMNVIKIVSALYSHNEEFQATYNSINGKSTVQ